MTLGVDLLRHQDGQRVDARTLERRFVAQLADDETLRVAERLEQTEARHLAEVADHRRHRHAFEQGFPHRGFVEPLRRDGFTRQVELVNELHDFACVRSALRLLERFDELRQFADCGILRHTVFTANLALHFAFAERIRARQHPAENRFVLSRRSLRVSEAEQVAVRPTIALLILHGLVREIVGLAVDIPAATALRRPRPQPRRAFTYSAKWNRCVPMRQTLPRFWKARALPAASPCVATSARAKMAGSFFGARPHR